MRGGGGTTAEVAVPARHPFPFDPTGGLDEAGLRALVPPPSAPHAAAYWAARHRRARAVDPRPRLLPAAGTERWRIDDLAYTSTDGVTIGGWLLRPRTGRVTRGLVVGHGYGGRDAPDLDLPVAGTAVVFPCVRGLGRSATPALPTDPARHVTVGIDRPSRALIGGCVEDLSVAVSVLAALHPEIGGRIGYSGVSLGGGLGALLLAVETRIDRAHLEVPTFGNMKLWLALPSVGSAAGAQAHVAAHGGPRGPAFRSYALHDAAAAAARVAIPTIAAVARFDPAVAPPTQWSVANALATRGPHETVVLDAGHFDYRGMAAQQRALRGKLEGFFAGP